MRSVTVRGMLFLMLALCARASWAQVAAVPADLEQAIHNRDAAVVKADAATWDRLTTQDFTVVTQRGNLVTKATRLTAIRKQKPAAAAAPAAPVKPAGHTITVYATSAVRRMKVNDTWVMELWVKDAQGWRAAAVQSTAVE